MPKGNHSTVCEEGLGFPKLGVPLKGYRDYIGGYIGVGIYTWWKGLEAFDPPNCRVEGGFGSRLGAHGS